MVSPSCGRCGVGHRQSLHTSCLSHPTHHSSPRRAAPIFAKVLLPVRGLLLMLIMLPSLGGAAAEAREERGDVVIPQKG